MPWTISYQFVLGYQGWQELLYKNTGTIEAAIASAEQVRRVRATGLAYPAYMSRYVIRDRSARGASTAASQLYRPELDGDFEANADIPSAALRFALTSGGIYKRSYWIRGYPDDWVTYNGANLPVISANARIFARQLWNAISDQGMGWYTTNFQGVNVPQIVQGVGADAFGRCTITVFNTAGLSVNSQIYVSKIRGVNIKQSPPGIKGFNGLHTIQNINGRVLTINLLADTLPGPPTWIGGGLVRPRVPTFLPADKAPDVVNVWIAEKRAGRSLQLSKARARITTRNDNSGSA